MSSGSTKPPASDAYHAGSPTNSAQSIGRRDDKRGVSGAARGSPRQGGDENLPRLLGSPVGYGHPYDKSHLDDFKLSKFQPVSRRIGDAAGSRRGIGGGAVQRAQSSTASLGLEAVASWRGVAACERPVPSRQREERRAFRSLENIMPIAAIYPNADKCKKALMENFAEAAWSDVPTDESHPSVIAAHDKHIAVVGHTTVRSSQDKVQGSYSDAPPPLIVSSSQAAQADTKPSEGHAEQLNHCDSVEALRERVALLEGLLKHKEAHQHGIDEVAGRSKQSEQQPAADAAAKDEAATPARTVDRTATPLQTGDSEGSPRYGYGATGLLQVSTPTDGSVATPPTTPSGKGKGKGKGKVVAQPPPLGQTPTRIGEGGKGKGKTGPLPLTKRLSLVGKMNSTSSAGAEPHKAEVQPKVPMKRLFWNSFILDDESMAQRGTSVWAIIDEPRTVETHLDTGELERLFGEHISGKDGQTEKRTVRRQRPRARLFEEARRRQVCVMLARLPPVDVTIRAITDMDDTTLDKDQVELLLANAPSPDEVAALAKMAKDMENQEGELLSWDDAEAFSLRLIRVPSYMVRLQLWAFENCFQEHFAMYDAAAVDVTRACEVLKESSRVQRMLALSLTVGNYLNAGTSRGRADGFSMDCLQQLRTLKTPFPAHGVSTLLDFLVQQLERSRPGDLDHLFSDGGEAQVSRLAARHKLNDLLSELDTYKRNAEGLARHAVAPEVDEVLRLRGRRAEVRLIRELVPLAGRLRVAQESYKELCIWFREGGTRPARAPNEFFAVWDEFLQAVQKSLEGQNRGRARRRRMAMVEMRRPMEHVRKAMDIA